MRYSIKDLLKFHVQTVDNEKGSLRDLIFLDIDEQKWVVRYLPVHFGGWIIRKDAVISPLAVNKIDRGVIHTSLTREQVESCPDIELEEPVSRKKEERFYDFFRWPYYWTGAGIWGIAPSPKGLLERPYALPSTGAREEEKSEEEAKVSEGSLRTHLRSAASMLKYSLEIEDKLYGLVMDCVLNTENWTVSHLVIERTKQVGESLAFLLPVSLISEIKWGEKSLVTHLNAAVLDACPLYQHDQSFSLEIENQVFEYDHFFQSILHDTSKVKKA